MRPASHSDLPAIYELNRKIEIGDKIPIVTPLEEFTDWVDDPHFSFDDDIRLAELDGRLVGYGNVWYRPSDSSQSRAFMLSGACATSTSSCGRSTRSMKFRSLTASDVGYSPRFRGERCTAPLPLASLGYSSHVRGESKTTSLAGDWFSCWAQLYPSDVVAVLTVGATIGSPTGLNTHQTSLMP
jgi:hypothetical protein